MAKKPTIPVIKNRKAYHDYTILETFEAGIALQGTEVKSLRAHKAQLQESYVKIKDHELFLLGLWIAPYSHGNVHNHQETRPRKLLMHKKEILKLKQKSQERLAIIPLEIYPKGRLFKVKIALARGKNLYDKRQKDKELTDKRAIDKAIKS
ncbi:MAG: SsrA-binding protein SmpB [Chlamydiota bacterium]